MDGRHFGVGMVAGLLFALAIVTVSGGLPAPPASPSGSSGGQVSTSVSSANTATTTAITGPAYAVSTTGTTPTSALGNLSSVKSLSWNTTVSSLQGSAAVPSFSSNLASINRLPTPSRALLIAPLVAAALLGALFYRASARDQRGSEE